MWKKAASLFVEIDETEDKKEEIKEPEVVKEAPEEAPAPAPAPVAIPGTIDPAMAEMLSDALQAADQPGFDYLEFSEALQNEAFKALPENARFQAVFAVAKTSGVTSGALVSSVEHYQNVLNEKKAQFDAHVEAKIAEEITARQEKQAVNEQQISEAQQKIAELTQFITERQQENIQIGSEISQEDLSIKNTASSFEATYNAAYGKLEEDKNKLKTYLGGEN